MKKCSKCGIEKEEKDFNKNACKKDGLQSMCAFCQREYSKLRYEICGREKKKIYTSLHKNEKKEYDKQYRENDKQYQKDRNSEYRKKNKIILNKKKRLYIQSIKEKDPLVKIRLNLRNRLNKILKGKIKSGSAIKDLGCSVGNLNYWIEQQFYSHPKTGESMTWSNYGKWHVDHIIPLSIVDLKDKKQLRKACHWFNLRPLWAEENLSRGNRISEEHKLNDIPSKR